MTLTQLRKRRVVFELKSSKDYGRERRGRLLEAIRLFEEAVNTEAFDSRVLEYCSFFGSRLAETRGLTQEEVLIAYKAWPGGEVTRSKIIVPLRLQLELEDGCGVYGFVRGGKPKIHTYSSFFDRAPPSWMAGHLAHEFAHVAGFSHRECTRLTRRHTVPYASGEIVWEIAEDIVEETE